MRPDAGGEVCFLVWLTRCIPLGEIKSVVFASFSTLSSSPITPLFTVYSAFFLLTVQLGKSAGDEIPQTGEN